MDKYEFHIEKTKLLSLIIFTKNIQKIKSSKVNRILNLA